MALPNSRLSDIVLGDDEQINQFILNRVFAQLVENDEFLAGIHGLVPEIWECKWFNDDNVPGYNKGDAFWLNTEVPQQFCEARSQEIMDYALQNAYLKSVISAYVPNSAKINALYMSILSGYQDYTMSSPLSSLYELGDISKPAQIRVSLVDDNKHSIYDDRYWKSFFVRKDEVMPAVEVSCQVYADRAFDEHVKMYHLGLVPSESKYFDVSQYANTDFSNVSTAVYKYKNRTTTKPLSGFDYVKTYVKKYVNYDSEISGYVENRWFRLWNSGYLEHGGIVKAEKGFDQTKMDVIFEWEYGKGSDTAFSPVYNYSPFKRTNRYTVSVTPIYKRYYAEDGVVKEKELTYPAPIHNELSNYMVNSVHVDECTNYGFTITVDNRYAGYINEQEMRDLHSMTAPYFQYYVAGYII